MTAFSKKFTTTSLLWCLFLSLALVGCANKNPEPSNQTTDNSPKRVLRHVVFFSFTDDATQADVNDIGKTLKALENSIDEIQSLEWGKNVAEGQTYSHCLLVNFASEEDLSVYAEHPDHLKFIKDYKQFFDQVTEIDYWAEI